LYMFFWVFPRHQIVFCWHFGTLCQFHLQRLDVENPAFEDGTDRGFRNVGKPQSDTGEISKRTYTMKFLYIRKWSNRHLWNCMLIAFMIHMCHLLHSVQYDSCVTYYTQCSMIQEVPMGWIHILAEVTLCFR
jgi:hypothetical protein